MSKVQEKKLERLRELFGRERLLRGELEEVQSEIAASFGGESGGPKIRKGGGSPKRKLKGTRKAKTIVVDAREEKADAPAGKAGKPCCGSKIYKHKKGCKEARVIGGEGTLPSDTKEPEKTWKCVNCEAKKKSDEAPEECEKCDGTVFVEIEAWQE